MTSTRSAGILEREPARVTGAVQPVAPPVDALTAENQPDTVARLPHSSDRIGLAGRYSGSPIAASPVGWQIRLRCPDVVVVIAVGTFLVVLSYTRSRAGQDLAPALYWTGQILLIGFAAVRLLGTSASAFERQTVVILYAASQSVIRWAYSPHMFTFNDELQHYRSLINVLAGHHLHKPNFSLAISPSYPGMENIAAAVAQVSSASPFVAGLIVASVSHVLLAGCLLLLFREISGSVPTACLGAILYLLNPHAQYFDTSFHYETAALPFVALAVFFSIRVARSSGNRILDFTGLISCVAVTSITHNVSAFAAVALVTGLGLASLALGASRRYAGALLVCALAAGLIAAAWIYFAAPATIDYLGEHKWGLLHEVSDFGDVQTKVNLPRPPMPLFDRLFSPVGVFVTAAILAAGLLNRHTHNPLQRVVSWLAAVSYPLVLAARLVIENGGELATRALTFAAFFTAPAMAVVVTALASGAVHRRHLKRSRIKGRLLTATALVMTLFLGTLATSLPEWWQRHPGKFLVDGFASGIDTVGLSRARWAAAYLPRGSRFFGDVTSITLLATLAGLDPAREAGTLYYDQAFTPANLAQINSQSAFYLDVDLRMADQPPMSGYYFPNDVRGGEDRGSIDIGPLLRFERIEGISRIYDSGFDRLYDLRWIRLGPNEN